METPLFFSNKSYKLFGILHAPEDQNAPLAKHKIGIIFCHPFAEEKLIAHRVLVNLSRKLTTAGVCCFRFDYMGHGDSEGRFEDSTVDTRLSDIRCAIDFLIKTTGIQKIGLLGLRFGGTLAALSCMNNSKINFLVLISPVIEGKPYIDQCLRSNLTTQMITYGKIIKDRNQLISDLMTGQSVNIDGYLINKLLFEQINKVNLLHGSEGIPENVLLLQISINDKQPFEKSLKQLYVNYQSTKLETELLNVKEEPFWKDAKMYSSVKRNMQEAILNWLLKVHSL